jgi:ubiquinone/menaquinone biosynthesis C-methylase UbiE
MEAYAEALPFDDACFDVVSSLVGALFAPRPELVARELVRVCGHFFGAVPVKTLFVKMRDLVYRLN